MSAPFRRALLALFAALPLAGCIDMDFARVVRLRKPAVDFEVLRVGETDLEQALEQLGAPLIVRELGDSAVLVWGWSRGSTWGLTLSVPLGDESGSVSYESTNDQLDGLLLIFDRDWTLTSARLGKLNELTRSLGQRPQTLDEIEASERQG